MKSEKPYNPWKKVCGPECLACAGEGRTEYDDDDFDIVYRTCDDCAGKGGWWRCISTRDYCRANPMPGREGVKP